MTLNTIKTTISNSILTELSRPGGTHNLNHNDYFNMQYYFIF